MKAHLLLLSLFGVLSALALIEKPKEERMESSEYGLKPMLANRIVRGQEAKKHSYPWMVSLRINGSHFCGGSLIDKQYVLTTAHCLNLTKIVEMVGAKPCSEEDMLPLIDVVLGDHYVKTTEPQEQVFGIADFKVLEPNKDRLDVPLLNDVAVLKLNGIATLNKVVSTIRQASSSVRPSPRDELTVAGWGSSKHPIYDPKLGRSKYPEKFSNVLKEAQTMVIQREECANYYHAMYDNIVAIEFGHMAGEDMICTREKNDQGVMSLGDSGNPLMYYDQALKEWLQIGIYSYRWGRKSENAYSYVPRFIPDIEQMKRELSYEKKGSESHLLDPIINLF